MKTELWIVFAQDGITGHVSLAGTYEVENDPLAVRHVLSTIDPETMNSTHFFAVRVKEGDEVSLHRINALPSIDEAIPGSFGHSNAHCGGCRDGLESRNAHVCEERS